VFAAALASPPAQAISYVPDEVLVEGAVGDLGIVRGGAALSWDWHQHLLDHHGWFLGGSSEVNVGYWQGAKHRTGVDSLFDVGFSPLILRVERGTPIAGLFTPFVNAGFGFHGFSEDRIDHKIFSLNFSFGEWLGAGVRFGPRQEFELGYRYQHLSNAGLGDTNPGINFHIAQLGYRF
jgi:hypothetical protein